MADTSTEDRRSTPGAFSVHDLDPAAAATHHTETSAPATAPSAPTAFDTPTADWLFQALLANLDGMVYRCRDDADWTMEFVSEGCARLTGYAPEDLLLNGRLSYEELTHPDDRHWVRETIDTAVAENRRFQVEYRIQHADGRVRWVWEHGGGVRDASGRVVAIEGIVEDITTRVESEQALREAERRYRSLFDNAIEGIFRTTPDGQYLDANPALARIYGFATPQELVDSLRDIETQLYVDSRTPRRVHAHRQGARRDQRLRVARLPQERRCRSGSRRTHAPSSTTTAACCTTKAPSRTSPSGA